MITISLYKAPRGVLDKLNRLIQTLRTAKKMFEQTASLLENYQLRNTILGLAQENRQYADELAAHIHIIGGDSEKMDPGAESGDDWAGKKKDWGKAGDERTAVNRCAMREQFTGQQYEEVLNEPNLHENLRKLILNQLQGVRYSLSQMRMLSTSLVSP
jgi:uncharacterized protein (TIGR02284 family)